MAHRPRAWPPGGLRHRLPAQSLGPRRAWRGRGALSALRHVTRHLQEILAGLRPRRRHGGGAAHRRRLRGHAAGDPRNVRALSAATIVCKRGPMGCVVFPGADPRRRSRTASRAPASRSRSTTCWAPATPSCPASCAAGCATSRSRPAAPTPMPAAPSPSRACCARRKARPGRSCSSSSPTARRTARCARTRRLNHIHWATTRRPRAPTARWRSPSTIARSSRRWPTQVGAPRERIAAVQAPGRRGRRPGRCRAAGLRHAARRHLWPRGAVPRGRPRFWIGRPVEKPGSRPLDSRSTASARDRRAPRRMAGHPHGQGAVLLPPRRSRPS